METFEQSVVKLSILRHQFERQMLRVRRNRLSGCSCAQKSGVGRRDDYRTDKSCDLCGPFVFAFNRARTDLDKLIARHMSDIGFSPEDKADEHIEKYISECRTGERAKKELFINV